MATRFDRGQLLKPHETADGLLLCEATFARDGVLEYRDAVTGKIRRELRLPEENKRALAGFGLAPVTLEHPQELVGESNADKHRKGITLDNVEYQGSVSGKGGFVTGRVAIFDGITKELIHSGKKVEISPGYTCTVEEKSGIWNGQHYDAIQRNIEINHIAVVEVGRNGPQVRLHLDSASAKQEGEVAVQIFQKDESTTDTKTQVGNMGTVNVRRDGLDFQGIPDNFAIWANAKFDALDAANQELEQLRSDADENIKAITELESDLQEAEKDVQRQEGRADGLEFCLTNAEKILTKLGYTRTDEGDYRKDMKNKKKGSPAEDMDEMDDEDYEEQDMAEDMDMEDEMPPKKKKKKTDSAGDRNTQVRVMLDAWKEADSIVPNLSESKFDAAESPTDVQRLVIEAVNPSLAKKLDGKSAEAIEVAYELLKDQRQINTDSHYDAAQHYSSELSTMISAARSSNPAAASDPLSQATKASQETTESNYLKPLALSRD